MTSGVDHSQPRCLRRAGEGGSSGETPAEWEGPPTRTGVLESVILLLVILADVCAGGTEISSLAVGLIKWVFAFW